MTENCGVRNWGITYWGGWMDGVRIDVSTDHGVSNTCAEREREREREKERERERERVQLPYLCL